MDDFFTDNRNSQQPFPGNGGMVIAEWRQVLPEAINVLTRLAGATEDEFLKIGSQLHDFYQRSSGISLLANQLVDKVSGEQTTALIGRLREMLADMEAYLAVTRQRSRHSCTTLSGITALLEQVSHPLASFQKMTKTLHMLGISTKIESSRLGELGAGFLTLAQDVGKLSELVSEKSARILGHRHELAVMIHENLRLMHASETTQDSSLEGVMAGISSSLEEITNINRGCSSVGTMISSIASEVSGDISEVVTSLQMHDTTRQQTEHIVEALQQLQADIENSVAGNSDGIVIKKLVIESGDACEIQLAQLQHATSDLCKAVGSIIVNLRDIACKQSSMATGTLSTTGIIESGGGSFIDTIRKGLTTVTAVLATCSRSDQEISATLQRVSETMQQITAFISDIEDIGAEIDLIALNSQIKAALTGKEGAALGVLAEAIKHLSVDAINQTAAISEILTQINSSTIHLFSEAADETEQLAVRFSAVENELDALLASLGMMNRDLFAILGTLSANVGQLSGDIERETGRIDVHTRVRTMSDQAETLLERIVENARLIEPASSEFKENLRHIEERYTMQSERRIHETLVGKRSGSATVAMQVRKPDDSHTDSGFGDNVDLF